MSNVDDLPEWVNRAHMRPPTDEAIEIQLTRLNYLQGLVQGQASRLDRQAETISQDAQTISELEQQVDIARAYEREKLALYFEECGRPHAAQIIRGAQLDG